MNYTEWHKWWVSRAEEYFTDKIWQFSQPGLINRLEIDKDHKVLEIGFGYGREISQFCNLSDNVHGVELTDWSCENTLQELKHRGVDPLPTLVSYDGVKLPYPDETFDVIYNCFVIQHLGRLQAKKLIKESLRKLKPDGKILFEFFGDPEYCDKKNNIFSGVDGRGGMFNNAYTKTQIKILIQTCGGNVLWIEDQPITDVWTNYWACFTR